MPKPKYGDNVYVVDSAGEEFNAVVMHIDDSEIEITWDGGNTSRTFWIDDCEFIEVTQEN